MSLISTVGEINQLEAGKTERAGRGLNTGFSDLFRTGLKEVSMDSLFEEAASRYNVSAKLLRAVAKAESNFNPNAVSKAGAMGVMQLMPGTARSLGVTNPFDARQNIMGGAKYLKENLEKFQSVELALAAYNAGPGSVQKYGGVPPYEETQNYVKKIMGYLGEPALLAGRTVSSQMGGSGLYGSGLYGNNLYGSGADSSWLMASMLYGGNLGSSSLGSGSLLSSLGSGGLLGGSSLGTGMYSVYGVPQLLAGLSVEQEGDKVVMDKDSFTSLVQLLRVQMMMNAGREVGRLEMEEA